MKEDNTCLKDLNNYIPNLLIYLWEDPKFMAKLLSNSDDKDIKNYLASFVVNNFYENILSSNYIEDNLIYVLTLMLKEEIDNLKNINEIDNFLNDSSHCGYLLYELRRKNDIQYFFKNVILNAINYLEDVSTQKFNLNIKDITDNINQHELLNDREDEENSNGNNNKKTKNITTDELYKKQLGNEKSNQNLNFEELKKKKMTDNERKKLDDFSEKYLGNLTLKEIKKMIKDNYINNINMKNYLEQLENCEKLNNNENYYSNNKLMDQFYNINEFQDALYYYQQDFVKIIDFIEQILTNLEDNLYLLPYSVKCLCKIISILIEKKFPNISATQKNAYIANFFFKKLLIPILLNPANEVLINNFIISKSTLTNIKIINEILLKLVSGKLFNDVDNTYYTPFNWYFIYKMPDILNIFEKITKVVLPNFIEELINNRLDENFKYDYFRENPEEIIFHRSICFNLYDIRAILQNLDKCINYIDPNNSSGKTFKKTFEKLNSIKNQKFLEELINEEDFELTKKEIKYKKTVNKDKNEKIDFENVRKKVNYYLLTSLIAHDKYKDLFQLQLDANPNYTIKELKNPIEKEDIIKNNIIKVKNFFISLLYNYRKLIITDFDQGTTSNTDDILINLKTFVKSSNNVIDDSIPSEWYIDSLLDYLKIIPEELTNNDCEILYNEIENELNLAIKKLDFEVLSVCFDKLKFTKRGKNYYEEVIKSTKQLELNEKVQDIIENEYIPVDISFKYTDNQKIFNIAKSKLKEKEFLKKQNNMKNKNYLCHNIKAFTEKFPSLIIFQEKQDKDIFEMQKELSIPVKLSQYFDLIKENLISNKIIPTSLDDKEINDKIYDYIMSKIYDKIFPKTNDLDDKIFSKTFMLSWIEPKHFIQGKTNYIFSSFLPGVIDCFKSIDKEKSPRKKILYMKEVFNSIKKCIKFNGGSSETGVDDEMPILNYSFVKAQPNRIYSNLKFIELYIGELKSKEEGSQLTQLLALCDFIIKLTEKDINGISHEQFIKKCNYTAIGKEMSSGSI